MRSQIFAVLGLALQILGAWSLARATGTWELVYGLNEKERDGWTGKFILWLFEKRGKRENSPHWWKVDAFRGFFLLAVGGLLQIAAVLVAAMIFQRP